MGTYRTLLSTVSCITHFQVAALLLHPGGLRTQKKGCRHLPMRNYRHRFPILLPPARMQDAAAASAQVGPPGRPGGGKKRRRPDSL